MNIEHIIVALVATLLFIAYDYLHQKILFRFDQQWPKYVAGFLMGGFVFPLLESWKYWTWIKIAAVVVLSCLFFAVVVTGGKALYYRITHKGTVTS
jgi:phosphoglycerol transferase MdoB-like AlkP superfamily enzyme